MQRNINNSNHSCELSQKPYGFIIHADTRYQSGLRCEFFIDPPSLRVLSFKGGVARTFVYRAVLEYLDKNGMLDQIEEIGGSSSGCNAAIFGCIPYEDSSDRIKAMDAVAEADAWDMMRDTVGWKAYKTISTPLSLFSSAVEWIGTGLNEYASEYSDTLVQKMAGYPFRVISQLFRATALISSPNFYAAIYNVISSGGIYHGEKIQAAFRDQIQLGVQAGLEALLEKQNNKELYVKHLQEIGLCAYVDHKLSVNSDITFYHLSELAKIPGSQFKECYLTSTRVKDKQLVVYNKDNTPHMPIHLGCRLVITFPILFSNKSYMGDTYFDGGVINNAPVDLASDRKLPDLYELQGVTDKLARLNIRVEYPADYQYHLWRQRPELSLVDKMSDYVTKKIALFLTRGEDSFANDAIVTRIMQNDYPQRTLQLKDFNISQLGSELTKEVCDDLCNQLMPDIEEYFKNHANEKYITNYELSLDTIKTTMPTELQTELVKFLQDNANKTEDIFDVPGEITELNKLRLALIHSLSNLSSMATETKYDRVHQVSTSVIHERIGTSSDARVNSESSVSEDTHHKRPIFNLTEKAKINNGDIEETHHDSCIQYKYKY